MNRPSDQPIATAKLALAKCAANDPWFPHPNEATVLAWSEHIARYNLEPGDVLNGVTAMYAANGAGFKPLPKDLTDAARAIRRDRTDRETDDERDARQIANQRRLQPLRVVEPGDRATNSADEDDARADIIAARIREHVEAIAEAKSISHNGSKKATPS